MKSKKEKCPPGIQLDEKLSLEEQIAQRAHELWRMRGRGQGSDLADWFQAEREVNAWHQTRLGKHNLK